jgi:hypothetical protein
MKHDLNEAIADAKEFQRNGFKAWIEDTTGKVVWPA